HAIRLPYVATILPPRQTFFRVIELPTMPDKEISEAVRWKLDSLTPWSEELEFDWQILRKTPDKLIIFAAGAKKETVTAIMGLLKKAKLIPTVMDLAENALARAVIPKDSSEKIILVNMGCGYTLFSAFDSGNLSFTWESELTGEEFTKAISKGMNVTAEEAETIGINCSSQNVSQENKQVLEILEPVFSDFAKEAQKVINYLQENRSVSDIKKIVLAGECPFLTSFAPFLALKLPLPVELADPYSAQGSLFKNLAKKIPLGEILPLSQLLGISLRALDPFNNSFRK
ncbi:MAG: Type IV pilus assembly protein PilM, partial [uncultured bacterium]